MKIAEIEDKLIKGNISDEIIDQFKTALKRVPCSHRCQHCYTTAVAFNERYLEQAVELIQYGLQYCDSWSDKMRAYHNLAIIYENSKDYRNALYSYKNALDAIPEEHKSSGYFTEYSAHLMRVEMHKNNFQYTDDLRKYYERAIQADSFSRAFIKKAFYEAVAESIIFKHDGKRAETKNALVKAKAMLSPKYHGSLTALLKRHKYTETVGATEEVLSYLKLNKI